MWKPCSGSAGFSVCYKVISYFTYRMYLNCIKINNRINCFRYYDIAYPWNSSAILPMNRGMDKRVHSIPLFYVDSTAWLCPIANAVIVKNNKRHSLFHPYHSRTSYGVSTTMSWWKVGRVIAAPHLTSQHMYFQWLVMISYTAQLLMSLASWSSAGMCPSQPAAASSVTRFMPEMWASYTCR